MRELKGVTPIPRTSAPVSALAGVAQAVPPTNNPMAQAPKKASRRVEIGSFKDLLLWPAHAKAVGTLANAKQATTRNSDEDIEIIL
mmetsp:Transcript_6457/g.13474  ORF Transcript_6457/g.13474 Transcript_6457/m.13474 type:complete len:86 (+) Transcript_6457:172-429(+)